MPAEFLQSPQIIYLNHAGVGPWPLRTAQVVQRFAEQNLRQGSLAYPEWRRIETALKAQLQRLLNAPSSEDIALLKNTSEVSSVFDFLAFVVLLKVFQADAALFHTVWFIESMATEVLVIFIIRPRRNPFRSRPNGWLAATSLMVVLLTGALPFTPLGAYRGFVVPPAAFFAMLPALVVGYLVAVEGAKHWFHRCYAPS